VRGRVADMEGQKDAQREILVGLAQMAREGEDVRFLNVYKGVPISFHGRILGIEEDFATFAVHPYQAICIRAFRETYLRSHWLPEAVRAWARVLDAKRSEVVLAGFRYAGSSIGDRMLVRVRPRENIAVSLAGRRQKGKSDDRAPLEAKLVDLSLEGLGLHVEDEAFDASILHAGREARLEFSPDFPESGPSGALRVVGKILNVSRDASRSLHRVGMLIFPEQEAKQLISRYIAGRQAEIVREIKSLQ